MDNGLVRLSLSLYFGELNSLNPCCSGQWSRTARCIHSMFIELSVLILVVVDNGLVRMNNQFCSKN